MIHLKQKIKDLVEEYFDEVINIRRYLHSNPELSFEEYNTTKYITTLLSSYGLEVITSNMNTGVVGILHGAKPGKVIALRADIDALPINEETDLPYKSVNRGVMHACGHDVHTASLLGVANILSKLKICIEGTIKFIFQPGEEKLPGGALGIINSGVLDNPKVDLIIGQHIDPFLNSGKVAFREGPIFASSDELYLIIKGRGGHAANPSILIDPLPIASSIMLNLQQIVSRNADPKTPTVLSFGKIIANGATNIVPDIVEMEGTFRTIDEKWRADAHKNIVNIAVNTAKSMRGECEVIIKKGYPVLINDASLTNQLSNSSKLFLGDENVKQADLFMGSEDFAYYSQVIPSCFYRLGVGFENNYNFVLHSSKLNINEESLKISVGLMAWLALKN